MKAEEYNKIAYNKFPNNKGLCSNKISLRRSAFIKGLEYAHNYNKRLSDELTQKQNDIDEILKLVNDLDLWLSNKVPVKFVNIYPAKNIINLIKKHTKK